MHVASAVCPMLAAYSYLLVMCTYMHCVNTRTTYRDQLSLQLVEGLDQLGGESIAFLSKNIRQLSFGTIPALLSGDTRVLRQLLAADGLTPALASAIRIIGLISRSKGFDAQKTLPLLRRLLMEPEAQRISVQMAQSLSERAVSRVIRGIFNVPQQARYDPIGSVRGSGTSTTTVITGSPTDPTTVVVTVPATPVTTTSSSGTTRNSRTRPL
jgi:hypothetical protein